MIFFPSHLKLSYYGSVTGNLELQLSWMLVCSPHDAKGTIGCQGNNIEGGATPCCASGPAT